MYSASATFAENLSQSSVFMKARSHNLDTAREFNGLEICIILAAPGRTVGINYCSLNVQVEGATYIV